MLLLTAIAKQFEAEITMLHVSNPILPEEFGNKVFEKFKEEAKTKLAYPRLDIQLIRHQDIVDGLDQYCLSTSANWLVMCPEKLSLLDRTVKAIAGESTSKRMAFHNHLPLLVIPDYYNTF